MAKRDYHRCTKSGEWHLPMKIDLKCNRDRKLLSETRRKYSTELIVNFMFGPNDSIIGHLATLYLNLRSSVTFRQYDVMRKIFLPAIVSRENMFGQI